MMQTSVTAELIPPARDRAAALQRARQEALVVLPDVARITGLGIADIIQMETGRIEVSPDAYEKIATAIDALVSEREHKYSAAV